MVVVVVACVAVFLRLSWESLAAIRPISANHTHTHTHTHARTHARTHTHARTRTHAHIRTHIRTHAHTRTEKERTQIRNRSKEEMEERMDVTRTGVNRTGTLRTIKLG